ncbi:dCTP deaminase [bacterium]|nr:dCTP deaminase [bacterium]
MILSDKGIKEALKAGDIIIEPFNEENLQPASYDLRLDKNVLVFDKNNISLIDLKKKNPNMMKSITIPDTGYIIHPGEFILSNLVEITGVNDSYVGRLEGKSSLARLGLIIHTTSGFLDPGNSLRMTLEIANLSPLPIKLYAGMKIGQMAFEKLDQPCERTYGSKGLNSKYVGNMTVQGSKMYENFDKDEK